MTKLFSIKVIIWDFDGTFYKLIPALKNDVREAEYRVIVDHAGWSKEKVVEKFNEIYKKQFKSATQVVAKLSHLSVVQSAIEMEAYYDRTKYLKRDERLIQMLMNLSSYTHFLFVNGIKKKIIPALHALGVPEELFAEIVTAELVGDTKPSLKGFQYILDKTQQPVETHLMIGDRIDVDLIPAKKLGMKTCLVWSTEKHPAADV